MIELPPGDPPGQAFYTWIEPNTSEIRQYRPKGQGPAVPGRQYPAAINLEELGWGVLTSASSSGAVISTPLHRAADWGDTPLLMYGAYSDEISNTLRQAVRILEKEVAARQRTLAREYRYYRYDSSRPYPSFPRRARR